MRNSYGYGSALTIYRAAWPHILLYHLLQKQRKIVGSMEGHWTILLSTDPCVGAEGFNLDRLYQGL